MGARTGHARGGATALLRGRRAPSAPAPVEAVEPIALSIAPRLRALAVGLVVGASACVEAPSTCDVAADCPAASACVANTGALTTRTAPSAPTRRRGRESVEGVVCGLQ